MWTDNKMSSDTFKVYGIRYDMSQVTFLQTQYFMRTLQISKKSNTLDTRRSHLTSNTWKITVNTAVEAKLHLYVPDQLHYVLAVLLSTQLKLNYINGWQSISV